VLKPYTQEFQQTYTETDGLASNDVRSLAVDVGGTVYFGTASGVSSFSRGAWRSWTKADGLSDVDVRALHCDMKGRLWAACRTGIYAFDGTKWAQYGPGFSGSALPLRCIAVAPDGDVFVGTRRGLYRGDGAGWSRERYAGLGEVRDIVFDKGATMWVAASNGLHRVSEMKIERFHEQPAGPLLSNDVRGMAVGARDTLWLGTRLGAQALHLGTAWSTPKDNDNRPMPYADVTCVATGPKAEVWCGTARGAVRYFRGEWDYRAGKRWLSGDRVSDIAVGRDGTVWIATEAGVNSIYYREMTLDEKAAYFTERVQARHSRMGFVTASHLAKPGDVTTSTYGVSDNDGLWTSFYVAAESFRYAVTGDAEARQNAKRSVEAMMWLEEVTPISGFPARAIEEAGQGARHGGEWHLSEDGKWDWKGDTSSDEIDGHYFAYYIYHDLVADDSERARIEGLVRRMTDHIIENEYCLIDVDGEPTRWGHWGPQDLLTPRWAIEKGLNSLEILSHLKVAYHITGDLKYEDAARELIDGYEYARNTIGQKLTLPEVNHSDDELAFVAYYPLLVIEEDPALRMMYEESVRRSWKIERPERSAFFNFVYGAGTGEPCDAELTVKELQDVPMSTIEWTIVNSHRADVETDERLTRFGEIQSTRALPVDERRVMKWNGNPYQLDGGSDGMAEDDGAFFLMPYWMGRYHNIIANPDEEE